MMSAAATTTSQWKTSAVANSQKCVAIDRADVLRGQLCYDETATTTSQWKTSAVANSQKCVAIDRADVLRGQLCYDESAFCTPVVCVRLS
uniref:Ricin B-type lectin domain-containing protein n=1 Tax=Ascaris lumbricoides TaxID=6252 RepID=A0A0M3IMS3_ASCLU